MNPELQKELVAWLAALRETAQQGTSFALEQAPLLVQEKIAYGRAWSLCLTAVCVVGFTVGVRFWRAGWVAYQAARAEAERRGDLWIETEGGVRCAMAAIGCVITGVFGVAATQMAVKAWFAPRLYIVEWLIDLLKGPP